VPPAVPAGPLAGVGQPTGPGFDIVLILHIVAVVVGFGTVVASGVQAARLLALPPGEAPPAALVRYYAPGVNWAARVLYAVPLLGLLLLGLSRGAYGFDDGWVAAGLALWAAAIALAEGLLWPAERRLGVVLAAEGSPPRRDGRLALAGAVVVVALGLAASALMIAQP